jgi:ribosome-associated toxin RatA of RatAB toxin-antitoxin module
MKAKNGTFYDTNDLTGTFKIVQSTERVVEEACNKIMLHLQFKYNNKIYAGLMTLNESYSS